MSTLKKYAYGLLLTTFGLINFGYCEFSCAPIFATEEVVYNSTNSRQIFWEYNGLISDTLCIINDSRTLDLYYNFDNSDNKIQLGYRNADCYSSEELSNYTYVYTFGNNLIDVGYVYFPSNCISKKMTTLQCQTEYNLIPISSVDQNYCVNNGLCPSSDYPIGTGDGNWSALYINNIQYNGAPTIRVTIPEEIERDNYTDEEETTIDVIGYGYDQDKMQQIVNTQYYKPTADEMSGLMEKVADFLPLVAVALLITRLRRVIKKVF